MVGIATNTTSSAANQKSNGSRTIASVVEIRTSYIMADPACRKRKRRNTDLFIYVVQQEFDCMSYHFKPNANVVEQSRYLDIYDWR